MQEKTTKAELVRTVGLLATDPNWIDKLSAMEARSGLRAALSDIERLTGEIEGKLSESSMRHFVAKREKDVFERCVEIAEETQCEFRCGGEGDVAAAIRAEFCLPKSG